MLDRTEPETFWEHLRDVWRVLTCNHWRSGIIEWVEAEDYDLRICTRCGLVLEVVPKLSSSESKNTIETAAAEQGVEPVTDFGTLLGDFWPEDESADDFIARRNDNADR